jgi:hypothetical protein
MQDNFMAITLLEAIKYFDKPNKHGLQPFKRNREWGLRNKAEKKNIVRNTYGKVMSKHPDSYYLAQRNNKWAIISPEGERLTSLKYDAVDETPNPNYILVQNYKNYWGVIDAATGNVKLPLQYRTYHKLVRPVGGYWFDKEYSWKSQKHDYFDKNFNSIKTAAAKANIWTDMDKLTGTFYRVENYSGEKGVWDKKTDSMLIPFGAYENIQFEKAAYGNPAYFSVRDQNYNEGIIDLNNNVLLTPNFNSVEPLAKFNLFDVRDYHTGHGGIYNLKTKSWVVQPSKQGVQPMFTKNGLFFIISNAKDKEGISKYDEATNIAKMIVPQAFNRIFYDNGIFHCAIDDGKKKADRVVIKYWPTKGFLSRDYHIVIKSIF